MEPIVNKVANSSLITLDLEEILTHPKEIRTLDIKDFLFQGLILKEKDFRQMLKDTDWSQYDNSILAIVNSQDAIIPTWAFMLLSSVLKENCLHADICKPNEILERFYLHQISMLDVNIFKDKRIVLKGCGKLEIPQSIYTALTARLVDQVKSLMFGEPCSTVPVFKKR